jgi:uncharacterized protein
MKFLIVIVVVVAVLWLIRSLRKPTIAPKQKPDVPPQNETMVTCTECGVHLPRSEALPGRGGVFCGEAHRKTFESGRND